MGCQYGINNNDKSFTIDNILTSSPENSPKSSSCLTEYTKTMFKLINKIRKNPSSFSSYIEKAIPYIKKEEEKIIFDYKLKVALYKGEEVFRQVMEELKQMTPMTPFEFKDDLVIEIPSEESQIKDINVFMNKIKEKKKNCCVDAYYKDAINDPEIAILLMIVDDMEKNSGKKRKAILNKDYKFIGISSVKEGGTFCAYYTFSK